MAGSNSTFLWTENSLAISTPATLIVFKLGNNSIVTRIAASAASAATLPVISVGWLPLVTFWVFPDVSLPVVKFPILGIETFPKPSDIEAVITIRDIMDDSVL